MPFLGLGLHLLFAIYFAVHAVRTHQGLYWVFILIMFPGLGSLVYFLAVWLPEARHSRAARRAGSAVRRILDPGRELREAQEAMRAVPSTGNRARLGEALLAAGRGSEAVPQFEAAARGLYADDPELQAKLAHALLEAGRPADARAKLDALIARHPGFRSPAAHLVYARAVAALGEQAQAREEFEVLVDSFPGLEARARYAGLLLDWGDGDRARALATETLAAARRLPRHTREAEREWIARLQKLGSG